MFEHAKFSGRIAEVPGDATPQVIFDYLAGEIFDRFEPRTRAFLLQIACLPRTTVAMAAALAGEPKAERVLDNLARNDYFVRESSSDAGRLYQLHPLLREFLPPARRAGPTGCDQRRVARARGDAAARGRPYRGRRRAAGRGGQLERRGDDCRRGERKPARAGAQRDARGMARPSAAGTRRDEPAASACARRQRACTRVRAQPGGCTSALSKAFARGAIRPACSTAAPASSRRSSSSSTISRRSIAGSKRSTTC